MAWERSDEEIMERYLKSLSMRAKDGGVLVPPVCCINCKDKECPSSCEKFQNVMGDIKCTLVEMEFGRVDTWWELLWRIVPYAILTGITVAFGIYICHRDVQKSVVSVDRFRCGETSDVSTSISFIGPKVEFERFSQALTNALQICKEMK